MAWRHVAPSLLDFFWYSLILESIREPHWSSKALSPTVFMIFMLVLIWWEFWVFWLSMRLQSQSLFLVSPSARGKSQVSRCIARSHAPFADYQQQWQWLAGRAPEDTENCRESWKEIQWSKTYSEILWKGLSAYCQSERSVKPRSRFSGRPARFPAPGFAGFATGNYWQLLEAIPLLNRLRASNMLKPQWSCWVSTRNRSQWNHLHTHIYIYNFI